MSERIPDREMLEAKGVTESPWLDVMVGGAVKAGVLFAVGAGVDWALEQMGKESGVGKVTASVLGAGLAISVAADKLYEYHHQQNEANA